jgi:hypothetical protein
MLYGWDQVATVVQKQGSGLGDHPFLVTTDYRSASALAYQLHEPNVIAISDRIDQFDFWYRPDELNGKNAVIVFDDWHPLSAKLRSQFEQVSPPITVPVKRFGIWIKNYYVTQGYGYKGDT